MRYFNPRSPRGERHRRDICRRGTEIHFNPRSPRGERHGVLNWFQQLPGFQSTLPSRGATCRSRPKRIIYTIISIHAPLAGSDRNPSRDCLRNSISIHAPLAGSDGAAAYPDDRTAISIHAPLAGSDHEPQRTQIVYCEFQSTLPSRGATDQRAGGRKKTDHFNPRSPRGERRIKHSNSEKFSKFQSTLPSRGATDRMELPLK